jgi:transcriptional regulator with XRE-family HTH domain
MEFPKRIEEIITYLGINQAGLAKKLSVSPGIVSEFITGAREPSKDFLFGLSKLGISIDWFFTGEGEMFHSETSQRGSKSATVALLEPVQPQEEHSAKTIPGLHLESLHQIESSPPDLRG